jgi:tellurite resistance protein
MTPEFFSEIDIDFEQVKVLCHAMMAVARVDGVHDNEMRLIREFYASCARSGDPEVEEVTGGDFDVAEAARVFGGSHEHEQAFVKSLILLAYADGSFGEAEDQLIRELAKGVGLDDAAVERLKTATQEYLMASLSHVQNLDALREVQKELD